MDSTNPSPIPTERHDQPTERHDQPTEHERGERLGRRLGSFSALRLCRRVLELAGPTDLAAILDDLATHDDLGLILRRLEDAADRAAEGGGGS